MANDHPGNKIDHTNIANVFSYHAPRRDQPERYAALRGMAREFSQKIIDCVPDCADRTVALRTVREALMWANAGIALEPEPKG
jgi:hypothetical protein